MIKITLELDVKDEAAAIYFLQDKLALEKVNSFEFIREEEEKC